MTPSDQRAFIQGSGEVGSIGVGGCALRYHCSGQGTPVLVIGSSVYYPRVFAPALRRQLRLICVDHRGFAAGNGDGPGSPSACTLDTLADELDQVRGHLGLAC